MTSSNARLQLYFNFGHHRLRADGKNLRCIIADLRPHVYIIENVSAPAKNPARGETFSNYVKLTNDVFTGVRKRTILPAVLVDMATDHQSMKVDEFRSFELQTIVLVPTLSGFYLENHGRGEEVLACMAADLREWNSALDELFQLRIQSAITHYKDSFPRTARCHQFREANIAENLVTLQEDLFRTFPQLNGAPKVRVFIRYGGDHRPIADVPTGADKTTVSFDSEEIPLNSGIMQKHIRGEIADIGDEVYLRALIEDALISAIVSVTAERYRADPHRMAEPSMGGSVRMAKKVMLHQTKDELLRCFEGNPQSKLLLSRIQALASVS